MRQLPLSESASVTLDNGGRAVARLGPRPHEQWEVTSVSITVSDDPNGGQLIPSATLYLGEPGGARLDGTDSGNNDTTDVRFTLRQGQTASVLWTDGNPGTVAIVNVYGTKVIR